MLHTLLASVLLPTIWIVDANNGPGTHFTDIPAAVAAAQSGDTILVRAGNYSPFAISGKALTIRGAAASVTRVFGFGSSPTVISSTPPGTTVALRGLRFEATNLGAGLTAQNNARVVLTDCQFLGGYNAPTFASLRVDGAEVHASRCSFQGGGSSGSFSPGYGSVAVIVANGARFAADASTLVGGQGTTGFLGSIAGTATGGNGLEITNAFAMLTHCSCIGGDVYQSFPVPVPMLGGDGAVVSGSGQLRLAGSAQDALRVGLGNLTTNHALQVVGAASAVLHGPIAVTGAVSGNATLNAPQLPRVTIAGTILPSGETDATQAVSVDFDGLFPNAIWVYSFSTQPEFLSLAPLAVGELLISLSAASINLGVLDATGHLTFAFVPAGAPALVGTPLHTQAGVFHPTTGELLMSNADIRVFAL